MVAMDDEDFFPLPPDTSSHSTSPPTSSDGSSTSPPVLSRKRRSSAKSSSSSRRKRNKLRKCKDVKDEKPESDIEEKERMAILAMDLPLEEHDLCMNQMVEIVQGNGVSL